MPPKEKHQKVVPTAIRIRCEGASKIPLDNLCEFQGDLKIMAPEDRVALKREIVETGIGFPFRCWRNKGKIWIIGGHQTKSALLDLREEGWKVPDLPVSWVEADTEDEARRRVLQDISQYGQVSASGLKSFMVQSDLSIKEIKLNFRIPQFNIPKFKKELLKLDSASSGGSQDKSDVVPKAPESPRSVRGQVFELGRHRLMCGDASSRSDVAKLANKFKPDCIVTSPPYNVEIGYAFHNDKLPKDEFLRLLAGVMQNAVAVGTSDLSVFWNMGVSTKSLWWKQVDIALELGLRLHRTMVWKKRGTTGVPVFTHTKKNPVTKNYHPHFGWELLFYFQKGEDRGTTKLPERVLIERESDVWEVDQMVSTSVDKGRSDHPAAFPVRLAEDAIDLFCDQWVYEPFGGSGSTLIAAEKTNRRCLIMEIDPKYCDVIVARWESFTGKKSRLLGQVPAK